MSKTIADLSCDLHEVQQYVREHRIWFKVNDAHGLTKAELAAIATNLAESEKQVLAGAVSLHAAQSILLNASARWLAKEDAGQDPSQEEVAH